MVPVLEYLFDAPSLMEDARSMNAQYRTAKPFPHIVIDRFLPKRVLRQLVEDFPRADDPMIKWRSPGPGRTMRSQTLGGDKVALSDERHFPLTIRHFMMQLNSWTFVKFLEELTGIRGLIVDPGFGGGGMHSTGTGGRLMIHTDVNRHTVSNPRLHQELNLIFFLNDAWLESYGGQLELRDAEGKPAVSITPVANRCVLFGSGTESFHGHPRPITAPEDRRRNSLAVYYYTIDRDLDSGYSGFQPDVNWYATDQADIEVQQQETNRLLARLLGGIGRRIALPALLMPAELCEQSGLGHESYAVVTILDWRQGLRESGAEDDLAIIPIKDLSATYQNLHLFATWQPTRDMGRSEPSLRLYVDTCTGKIYGKATTSRDVFWLGYGDLIPPYT